MKNLRQMLHRPVGQCDANIWTEDDDDGSHVIFTSCTHLKEPRETRITGPAAQDPVFRDRAFEEAREDVRTHMKYSDPW